MSISSNTQPLSREFLQRQQEYTERSAALRAELEAACGELELLEQVETESLRRGQRSPRELGVRSVMPRTTLMVW